MTEGWAPPWRDRAGGQVRAIISYEEGSFSTQGILFLALGSTT